MSKKKNALLGMNAGTASNRLVKDILFDFVVKAGHKCHQCGGDLTRETFSIEHVEAWMSAEDPVATFFDLENISFSHRACNYSAAERMKPTKFCGTRQCYTRGCRCDECVEANAIYMAKYRTPEIRRAQYLRTGN